MREIKSSFQKQLEAEGWEFLTNEDPNLNNHDYDLRTGLSYETMRQVPYTNDELKNRFLDRGFKDVRAEIAFDIYGEPCEGMRAIYVKRQEKKD